MFINWIKIQRLCDILCISLLLFQSILTQNVKQNSWRLGILFKIYYHINSLSANPTKWSNTFKQFVGNLLRLAHMKASYQGFDEAICLRFELYLFAFLIVLYWIICFQNSFGTPGKCLRGHVVVPPGENIPQK